MQNYNRLYDYINEYQKLIFETYGKHAIAYLITYWNINDSNDLLDKQNLMAGSYERLGDLSSYRFTKYLKLPVYFSEEMSPAVYDASEKGYRAEQVGSFIIPSLYNIVPFEGDFLTLDESFLTNSAQYKHIYIVTGKEAFPNTDQKFWKIKYKTFYESEAQLQKQVVDTKVFFEYDKKIHNLDDTIVLTKLLLKNEKLKESIEKIWDLRSGFFLM